MKPRCLCGRLVALWLISAVSSIRICIPMVGTRPFVFVRMRTAASSLYMDMTKRQVVASALSAVGGFLSPIPVNAAAFAANPKRKVPGMPKVKKIQWVLDEMDKDIAREDWEFLGRYETVLRKFLPAFTSYNDNAFPSPEPIDQSLRSTLRYEVGQFYRGVTDLNLAVEKRDLAVVQKAYTRISIAYDHYLKAGDLYEDSDVVSTEQFFQGISDDMLVFLNPIEDPPKIRDQVLFIKGLDKGRTGVLIGMDGLNGREPTAVVKLDYTRQGNFREVRSVPSNYVAKCVQQPNSPTKLPRSTQITFKLPKLEETDMDAI